MAFAEIRAPVHPQPPSGFRKIATRLPERGLNVLPPHALRPHIAIAEEELRGSLGISLPTRG
jgi:hypothetical protein